jgi:excisionase family DNA binding protein
VANRKQPSADHSETKARMSELATLFSDGVISEHEWRTARARLEERLEPLDEQEEQSPARDRRAYGVKEAARLLGVGKTTVYKLINTGELAVIYVGGRTLIPDESITEFLATADTERHHHRGRRAATPTPSRAKRSQKATTTGKAKTRRLKGPR